MSFISSIPTFAAEEFNRRADFARAAVRKGTWSRQDAYQKLAPWLAMALRCGSDVDDLNLIGGDNDQLHRALADRRVKSTTGRELCTDGQARWFVAEDICPRRVWVAELTKARDAAIRAARVKSEASLMQAAGLIAMASLIGADPDGRYSVPPHEPAPALQEAA